MLFLYKFLSVFLYPIITIVIILRKFLKKEDPVRFKEKIFYNSFSPRKNKLDKLIWFHAASIGEMLSIIPIIEEWSKKNNQLKFLITTVTLSSGKLFEKKFFEQKNILHRYFPIDCHFIVKKFLKSWRPSMVIFVDSEIWPNFLTEIKLKKIPLVLLNGRITEKSFKKWLYLKNFAKKIFSNFDLCLSSSLKSSSYLEKLGVNNIKFFGNLKFSVYQKKTLLDNQNSTYLKNSNTWLAASTHEGEEEICIKTHFEIKKKYNNVITIIAPRHINRVEDIGNLASRYNLKTQILKPLQMIDRNKELIIVDSFGELSGYYQCCKSVFMGKSILQKLKSTSGQNPIEAAKLGCRIYSGPFVNNFKEIYKYLEELNISKKVENYKELSQDVIKDLNEVKKEDIKKINVIQEFGEEIKNKTVKELNNFL
jgi:3-deoxy-D-manno-octulosonic-acid transferase